jgi:hypothetical protein
VVAGALVVVVVAGALVVVVVAGALVVVVVSGAHVVSGAQVVVVVSGAVPQPGKILKVAITAIAKIEITSNFVFDIVSPSPSFQVTKFSYLLN